MHINKIILLSLFLLGFLKLEAIEITHGPYLQNPGLSGVTVLWNTDSKGFSYIEYGENNLDQIGKASVNGQFDANKQFYKIVLRDLKPGTSYKYRVVTVNIKKMAPYHVEFGDTIRSKVFSFTTLNEGFEEFSFSMVNDIHERSQMLDSLISQGEKDKPDLYFFNGDMLNDFDCEEQFYNGFLDASVKRFASEIPFIFVRGNHETRGKASRDLGRYLGLEQNKYYYAFTHKGVNFIILDSGEDKEDDNKYYYGLADFDNYRTEQQKWLEHYVETPEYRNAKYRIVLMHMPLFKKKYKPGKNGNTSHGTLDAQKKWAPFLEGTDLLLAGHTHKYSYLNIGDAGNNYPILINDDKTILNVKVTNEGLKLSVVDSKGNELDKKVINGRLHLRAGR